jgi:hypothetical protein
MPYTVADFNVNAPEQGFNGGRSEKAESDRKTDLAADFGRLSGGRTTLG